MTDLVELLNGLIASVPEAADLYQKVAPLIVPKADIHPDIMAEIETLAPIAIGAVAASKGAIQTIVDTHRNMPPGNQPAQIAQPSAPAEAIPQGIQQGGLPAKPAGEGDPATMEKGPEEKGVQDTAAQPKPPAETE